MDKDHIPHIKNIAYGGLLRTITPDDVADKLVQDGYARRAIGGLVATDTAHQFLIENGHLPQKGN